MSGIFTVGAWEVQPNKNKLILNNEEHYIEPLAMDVLVYFASNAQTVISRDELIENVWQGRIVGDHAVYRVINQLRRVLEQDTSVPYIETIRKKGYQLLAKVDWQQVQLNLEQKAGLAESSSELVGQVSIVKKRWSFKRKLFLAFSIFLLINLVIFATQWYRYQSMLIFTESATLLSLPGEIQDPAYSFDGLFIAFSYRAEESKHWNIMIKSTSDGGLSEFTRYSYETSRPAWSPDGRYIAYVSYKDNRCQLVMKAFNKDAVRNIANEGEVLTECQGRFRNTDLVWGKDGQSIFFTSSISETGPSHIFELNIKTKKKEQLTNLKTGKSAGVLRIKLSPDGENLAFLKDIDWGNTSLNLLSLETWKSRELFKLIGWNRYFNWSTDGESLLYNVNSKSIYAYDLQAGIHKEIANNVESIGYPVYSPVADEVMVVTGQKITNIWGIKIPVDESEKEQLLIESSALDGYAQYANTSDDIAFISRRTGKLQIWLKKEAKSEYQLSKFTDYRNIFNLKWSPDDKYLLYDHDKQLYVMNVDTGEEVRLLNSEQEGAIEAASWAKHNDEVYFSSDMDGDWQIYKITNPLQQTTSQKVTKVTTNGGYSVAESNKRGSIYYLKYHLSGLWYLDNQSKREQLIIDNIDVFNYKSWYLLDNYVYYLSNDSSGNLVYQFDLGTQQKKVVFELPSDSNGFSISKNQKSIIFSKSVFTNSSIILLKP